MSTCRYFHRPLNWQKLYEVGFSAIPPKSSETLQNAKYRLPANATTKGLRKMQKSDVDGVLDLLQRYLERFDLAQNYSREEVQHWLLNEAKSADEQVIWAYVVEDADTHKITDFLSYYSLPSTVIGKKKHSHVNAAYLFYYATASAFNDDAAAHKARLNLIMTDALTLAKQVSLHTRQALLLRASAHAPAAKLRRDECPHPAPQPAVPGEVQVRAWRRSSALLPVQLQSHADCRRHECQRPAGREVCRRDWSRDVIALG